MAHACFAFTVLFLLCFVKTADAVWDSLDNENSVAFSFFFFPGFTVDISFICLFGIFFAFFGLLSAILRTASVRIKFQKGVWTQVKENVPQNVK